MKALKIFYVLVWIYIVYYSAYMIHMVLGDDAYPLFIAIGLLVVIRGAIYYVLYKMLDNNYEGDTIEEQ